MHTSRLRKFAAVATALRRECALGRTLFICCETIGFQSNHHAPAADAPAIPRKSGSAFGIPELTPPNRRQDYQSKDNFTKSQRLKQPLAFLRQDRAAVLPEDNGNLISGAFIITIAAEFS